jgi:hypothetical protein
MGNASRRRQTALAKGSRTISAVVGHVRGPAGHLTPRPALASRPRLDVGEINGNDSHTPRRMCQDGRAPPADCQHRRRGFSESGFRDDSLRDVADRVDLSQAGLLHHYPARTTSSKQSCPGGTSTAWSRWASTTTICPKASCVTGLPASPPCSSLRRFNRTHHTEGYDQNQLRPRGLHIEAHSSDRTGRSCVSWWPTRSRSRPPPRCGVGIATGPIPR